MIPFGPQKAQFWFLLWSFPLPVNTGGFFNPNCHKKRGNGVARDGAVPCSDCRTCHPNSSVIKWMRKFGENPASPSQSINTKGFCDKTRHYEKTWFWQKTIDDSGLELQNCIWRTMSKRLELYIYICIYKLMYFVRNDILCIIARVTLDDFNLFFNWIHLIHIYW